MLVPRGEPAGNRGAMKKSIFLQTYGCQMNERDSEELLGMLTAQGYEIAEVSG